MDRDQTTMTRAFSGKPARGMRNRFTEAAEREGWSRAAAPGQRARPLPAAELVRVLVDEAREVIDHLRRVAGGPAEG